MLADAVSGHDLERSVCSGPPLTLYRGAEADERRRRIYGFSWSTDIAKARLFAEHWERAFGTSAVVLRTVALPEAVLLVRQPGTFSITTDGEEYRFDEDEVVVDPFQLGRVDVAERLKEVNPADHLTERISYAIVTARPAVAFRMAKSAVVASLKLVVLLPLTAAR